MTLTCVYCWLKANPDEPSETYLKGPSGPTTNRWQRVAKESKGDKDAGRSLWSLKKMAENHEKLNPDAPKIDAAKVYEDLNKSSLLRKSRDWVTPIGPFCSCN